MDSRLVDALVGVIFIRNVLILITNMTARRVAVLHLLLIWIFCF
jgi:hypothetical protein